MPKGKGGKSGGKGGGSKSGGGRRSGSMSNPKVRTPRSTQKGRGY